MNTDNLSYIEAIIFEARSRRDENKDKAPNAAPLDLLTRSQLAEMDAFLDRNYGAMRQFIDEHYVALLFAMREYEVISDNELRSKITAHLVHNIKNA